LKEKAIDKNTVRQVRIAGQAFALGTDDVMRALRDLTPEPIASHFVVVGDRRFPPKQVISAVTGLDRADFTTHQARRTLMRLGFLAGRRGTGKLWGVGGFTTSPGARVSAPEAGESLADHLRARVGRWVAIKGDDVLYDAETPQELVRWLTEHGQKADTVFRVPEDEVAATGLAPQ
jgi:hypothetical protein